MSLKLKEVCIYLKSMLQFHHHEIHDDGINQKISKGIYMELALFAGVILALVLGKVISIIPMKSN